MIKSSILKYIAVMAVIFTTVITASNVCAEYDADEALGTVSLSAEDLSIEYAGMSETLLGDLTADAIRNAVGADIAVVAAAELEGRLSNGPVTVSKLDKIYSENAEISTTEVSLAELVEMLEHSVSGITMDMSTESIDKEASMTDGFLCVSGLSYTYDCSAAVGNRIRYIYDADGNQLDPDTDTEVYTLAASSSLLEGAYGYSAHESIEHSGISFTEAVADFIAGHGDDIDSNYPTGRIKVIGTADNNLISNTIGRVPVWALLIICIAFVYIRTITYKRSDRFEKHDNNITDKFM